jgi:hypothetical protein
VKKADDLSIADFQDFPAWRFTNAREDRDAPAANVGWKVLSGNERTKVQPSKGTGCCLFGA